MNNYVDMNYCDKCGDSLLDHKGCKGYSANTLALRNDFGWRQEDPEDQSVVIMQSIRGWLSNLEAGVSSKEKVLEHVNSNLLELEYLHAACLNKFW